MVDGNEKRSATVRREFAEEVLNKHDEDPDAAIDAFMTEFDRCIKPESPYAGYVDDTRNPLLNGLRVVRGTGRHTVGGKKIPP